MICVSLREKDFEACRRQLAQCPMAELRGDLCGFGLEQVETLVREHPCLLYTHRQDGKPRQERTRFICAAIRNGARYADIELDTPPRDLACIRSLAKTSGCTLIISYHDFNGTPSLETLQDIYRLCCSKGADIVKIVTTAHDTGDASRVMQLYRYHKACRETVPDDFPENGGAAGAPGKADGQTGVSLVAFCMGEKGRFTRELCLDLGAPFTYAAFDSSSATAPGQYTKNELEVLKSPESHPYRAISLGESVFARPESAPVPEITVPCSKSIAQRAILAAALSRGTTVLENYASCADTRSALRLAESLGADIRQEGDRLEITGRGARALQLPQQLFTGESGLLARLMLPLAAVLAEATVPGNPGHVPAALADGQNGPSPLEDKTGNTVCINGTGSLLRRPLPESRQALQAAGICCRSRGGLLPFEIRGGETAPEIRFSGKGSSQIVSGFLMALPLAGHDTVLTVTEPASIPYIRLTLRLLETFGIKMKMTENLPRSLEFRIPGNQEYRPSRLRLDADWSSAACFAVAGALCGGVVLRHMPLECSQADGYILEVLRRLGYGVTVSPAGTAGYSDIRIGVRVREVNAAGQDTAVQNAAARDTAALPLPGQSYPEAGNLPRRIGLEHCPDLFPIAAVLAANTPGLTVFSGTGRLRHKESDRAESIFTELTRFGYDLRLHGNELHVYGNGRHIPEKVLASSHNDHRIAMSLQIAQLAEEAARAKGLRQDAGALWLDNIHCIEKSFPTFVEKLKR